MKPNFEARTKVIEYIALSRRADRFPELEELLWSKEEVVVWGAGAFALRLLKNSPLGKLNIIGFADNDVRKQGAKIGGRIGIYAPQEILTSFKGTIVVCSAVYPNEIIRDIEKLGLPNRIVVVRDTYENH